MATSPDARTPGVNESTRSTFEVEHAPARSARRGFAADWVSTVVVVAVFVILVFSRSAIASVVSRSGALATWLTVFVAMSLQALPFLVLGVVLSALISVAVPDDLLRRLLPRHPALAVPAAGAWGIALPGCECASVPVSGSLVSRGIPASVALTFQLAAPAVNPVVLVSTAVAFGGRTDVVFARFAASLVTAIAVGYLWLALGRDDLVRVRARGHAHGSTGQALVGEIAHDVLHAGGFLVVGAAIAACISVFVPRTVLDALAGNVFVSVIVLALFAVVVAMCSEADAFVAAGLTAFPLPARLVFLVVGPVVDVKLIAMEAATYGRSFALRFAPLSFVVATVCAALVGMAVLS